MPPDLELAAPAAPPQTAPERRLHPLSWLFVLLGQLLLAMLLLVALLVTQHRALSARTVAAYRDAFMLFLEFAQTRLHKPPTAMLLRRRQDTGDAECCA